MPSGNCHSGTSLPAARLPPSPLYLSPITAVICISMCATGSRDGGSSPAKAAKSTAPGGGRLPHLGTCAEVLLPARLAPGWAQGHQKDTPAKTEMLQEPRGTFSGVHTPKLHAEDQLRKSSSWSISRWRFCIFYSKFISRCKAARLAGYACFTTITAVALTSTDCALRPSMPGAV